MAMAVKGIAVESRTSLETMIQTRKAAAHAGDEDNSEQSFCGQ